jgi:hypothetical protein
MLLFEFGIADRTLSNFIKKRNESIIVETHFPKSIPIEEQSHVISVIRK